MQNFSISPKAMVASWWRNRGLVNQLNKSAVAHVVKTIAASFSGGDVNHRSKVVLALSACRGVIA